MGRDTRLRGCGCRARPRRQSLRHGSGEPDGDAETRDTTEWAVAHWQCTYGYAVWNRREPSTKRKRKAFEKRKKFDRSSTSSFVYNFEHVCSEPPAPIRPRTAPSVDGLRREAREVLCWSQKTENMGRQERSTKSKAASLPLATLTRSPLAGWSNSRAAACRQRRGVAAAACSLPCSSSPSIGWPRCAMCRRS